MWERWTGCNVALDLLGDRINRFFSDLDFVSRLDPKPGGFVVEASNSQFRVRVNLRGEPSDFTVEFVPGKKTQGFSLSMVLSYVATSFGGGPFLLRDLKLQEAINQLESIFWKEVDRCVAELGNPAQGEKRE